MPQLEEITEKPKFKKFRPWDLNGEGITAFSSVDTQMKKETGENKGYTRGEQEVIESKSRGNLEVNKGAIRGKTEVKQRVTRDRQEVIEEITRGNLEVKQEVDIDELKVKLFGLVGHQKKIFFYILTICYIKGNITTGSIATKQMALENSMSYYAAKDALKALIKKNLIKRLQGKACRGGFIHLEMPSIIKKVSILLFEKELLQGRTRGIQEGEREVELEVLGLSSSSLLNKTTTTYRGNDVMCPGELSAIDIAPLQEEIGFTISHLSQIISQFKLSTKAIQDSINAFAFDLKENKKRDKIKEDPINYFMGILRKYGVYLPPSNYEPPKDHYMRLYIEKMTKIELKNKEIESKAFELAFKDWFSKLSYEQKKEFMPKNLQSGTKLNGMLVEGNARSHFREEQWLNIRDNIVNGTEQVGK